MLSPEPHEPGTVVLTQNHNTGEVEARESEAQGYPLQGARSQPGLPKTQTQEKRKKEFLDRNPHIFQRKILAQVDFVRLDTFFQLLETFPVFIPFLHLIEQISSHDTED